MGVISNGTTLLDAGALDSGIPTGAMTLIKTLTASSSGTLSFVDGSASVVLDGTYKEYIFKFFDIHPATNDVEWSFQGSTNTGSSYGVSITSSAFDAYHNEADSATALSYQTDQDLANSTNFQIFQHCPCKIRAQSTRSSTSRSGLAVRPALLLSRTVHTYLPYWCHELQIAAC